MTIQSGRSRNLVGGKNKSDKPGYVLLEPNATRLSRAGYSMPKSALGQQQLDALCKELTVSPVTFGNNGPGFGASGSDANVPSFKLWLESATRISVPKYFGLQRFGLPAMCTMSDGLPAPLEFCGRVRPEQMGPIDAFVKAAYDPSSMGGILSLPCGSGKTVIALYLMSLLGRKTLIVVHKEFLLQQWRERIAEFLPTARVGMIKAQVLDVVDRDIVIASLQSLSIKEYDPKIFEQFGFLIVDEVHRTGTEVFSRAFHKINVRYSLGLSATVKRKDGMSKVFEWFIGKVVYSVAKRVDRVRVWVRPYYDVDPRYSLEPLMYGGKVNMSRMINNITDYAPRTRLIVDFLIDMLNRDVGRRALVLSDRKQHLRDIARLLEEVQKQKRDIDTGTATQPRIISSGMYVGSMKPKELSVSQTRDVILATFSFASEGFDVPGLDTLVIASPKSDIEQSVGRILRQKAEDRRYIPLIFDIADNFSVFRGQTAKRQLFYKKHDYEVLVGENEPSFDEKEKNGSGRGNRGSLGALTRAAGVTATAEASTQKKKKKETVTEYLDRCDRQDDFPSSSSSDDDDSSIEQEEEKETNDDRKKTQNADVPYLFDHAT